MTSVQQGLNWSQLLAPKPNRQGVLQLDVYPAVEMWGWGATMVRIHVHQEHWLEKTPAKYGFGPGPATTNYRQAVIDAVNATADLGMGAMVSLVATGHGTGLPVGAPILKPMADLRAVTFWESAASEFAGYPLVVLDLFNEPHDIAENVWRDGGPVSYREKGTFRRPVINYRAAGMNALLRAVRSNGFDGIVCLSGTGWATDATVHDRQPLTGDRIVRGQHAYPAARDRDPHQSPRSLNVRTAEVASRVPLIVSEFGWQWGMDGAFLASVIDWCESHQVGWLAYHYGPPAKTLSLCDRGRIDVGKGITVAAPSKCGLPVWDALAPHRKARGLTV